MHYVREEIECDCMNCNEGFIERECLLHDVQLYWFLFVLKEKLGSQGALSKDSKVYSKGEITRCNKSDLSAQNRPPFI